MDAREFGLPETLACPFCEGSETELHSPFGTALTVATYWCRKCRTAFDWVKWDAPPEQGEAGGRGASSSEATS